MTEPQSGEAGGKVALCTLGIVVLRNLTLGRKQVTYFLCTLHLPAYFAKDPPANYACPVKGAGEGRRTKEKFPMHMRAVGNGPLPRPPPNTFYINSTHKAYSTYFITLPYPCLGFPRG